MEERRQLGSSELQVSPLGYGTWALGGDLWKDQDPRLGQRTLMKALGLGLNFVDTALIYGDGNSESLVGEAIREVGARDYALVATKIPPANLKWPAPEKPGLLEVFAPDYIQHCVERSLRNLKAEVLHLCQFHVWNDAWLHDAKAWSEVRATMKRMVKEGKVLYWGISVNDHQPDSAMKIIEDELIVSAQIIYNIFDQSPRDRFFDHAEKHGTGIIARVPLDEGALSGNITPETAFIKGDFRARYFKDERKAELAEHLDQLRPLLSKEDEDDVRSLAELALRFCFSEEKVCSTIPGMRKEQHMLANVDWSLKPSLTRDLMTALYERSWDKNWYQ